MNCSVIISSRGRKEKLEYYLHKLYSLAKYPELVETLIRVDDDDLGTINSFTPSFCGEYRKYIRMYTGPRVGICYLWLLFSQLAEISTGEILLPFADDCDPCFKDWDDMLLQYKDKAVVIGWKLRMAFTRLAFNKYEGVRTAGHSIKGAYSDDVKLMDFALRNNFYCIIKRLYRRVQPNDQTQLDGAYGQWKLNDLSILDNLTLKEIL
jgi:hypothetical protein